jgi:hypothetical protein
VVEAAVHASTHPTYRERYQRTKTRLGKQRGAKVAQVDLARRLAEAIWHMLTRDQPFAPAGAADPWPPEVLKEMRYRSADHAWSVKRSRGFALTIGSCLTRLGPSRSMWRVGYRSGPAQRRLAWL